MKKMFSYCSLFLIGFFFSCKNKIPTGYIYEGNVEQINFDSSEKTYSLASAIDSVRVVNLETNGNSLISSAPGIEKVILKDGKFFILDNKFMSIKVFDTLGKYLYDLGTSGIGKGEFRNVQDMEYYQPHNSLLALCNTPSKVVEFSLNGKVIDDVRLNFYASSLGIQATNTRFFYVNQNRSMLAEKKDILITDSLNDVTSRLFDIPKNIPHSVKFTGGIYTTNGQVYFNPPFSYSYYLLSNDSANEVYKINYGRKNIPKEISLDSLQKILKNYAFQLGTFVKTKNYIGFNYVDKRILLAFFNTHSGHLFTSDIKSDSLNLFFYNSVYESDGKLFMVLETNNMSAFLKRYSNTVQQRFPSLYTQLMAAKAHQNPSLILFTLKNL
jgi:6-bladed beta-propeller